MPNYFIVDAFTDRPFAGNPAAVVLLDGESSEPEAASAWMQRLASEFNLSETAFVAPEGEASQGQIRCHLRWFTPAIEVPLCGHATLAAAHVLLESDGELKTVTFRTLSGDLTVRRSDPATHRPGYVMDFPAWSPEPWRPPASALAALGLDAEETVAVAASFHHPDDWYVVIELQTADDVRAIEPDMRALGAEGGGGWIVTARADDRARQDFGAGVDIVSRFFAPAMGVDEDPVTGSAHCLLMPFWQPRLGASSLLAAQISRRGGVVRCAIENGRVELGGAAVTVAAGQIVAP